MKKNFVTEMTSFLLVLLFTYASVSKLLDLNMFAFQMSLSPVRLIKIASPLLKWIIPIIEIEIVLSLLMFRSSVIGLWSSLVLLAAFEIYITAMLLSGLRLPCTCGGIISKFSWRNHLLLNGAFILLTIISLIIEKRNFLFGRNDKDISENFSRA